jgi:NDP-sugar pyrophosphorylase family protein
MPSGGMTLYGQHATDLHVAILAGGLATRLRPLTETVPKVLLTVAGRPFLHYQLDALRRQNIRHIVICAGFLGEMIQEQFGDGHAYGVDIRYSFDTPALLGTGGAIRLALPLLGDPFFVLYGDSFLPIDYDAVAQAFLRSGKQALMTVYRNHNQWDISNIEFQDDEIRAYDKKHRTASMAFIDYGLSMYRAEVFQPYPASVELDLSDVVKDLLARKALAGYEAQKRFYEIGSFSGIDDFTRALESEASPFGDRLLALSSSFSGEQQ